MDQKWDHFFVNFNLAAFKNTMVFIKNVQEICWFCR